MNKKFNCLLIGSIISSSAMLVAEDHVCKNGQYCFNVDLGPTAFYAMGHDNAMFSGEGVASFYAASCSSFSGKVYLSLSYGKSSKDFKNTSGKSTLTPVGAIPVAPATYDGQQDIGVEIVKGSGLKEVEGTGLIYIGRNICLPSETANHTQKRGQDCTDCAHVNMYGVFGGTFGKIESKVPGAPVAAKWSKNVSREILGGVCFDGGFPHGSMLIVPSVVVVFQFYGKTKVHGYSKPTATTNAPAPILNNIELSRNIRPIVIMDVKITKQVADSIFIGITPFFRVNYRSMQSNTNKLDDTTPIANLGDILEYNIRGGIQLTAMYSK